MNVAELIKLVLIVLGVAASASAGDPAVLTWYGSIEDGYLGARHGASWHGDSCGLPEVVDLEGYGAAAPAWVPYCSRLLVCVGERCVVVVAVDRQRDDVLFGLAHLDLWPAPADALGVVGPGVVEGWFAVLPDL